MVALDELAAGDLSADDLAVLGRRRISRFRLALDRFALPPRKLLRMLPGRPVLVHFTLAGWIALAAALLVAGTIAVNGFSGNALRLGSQMGWRFANLVFFAVLAAAPVGRLAGRYWPAARALEARCPNLIWGFCASYGVYLLAVLVPNSVRLSGGALLFVLFGAGVIAVMAVAAAPLRLIHGTAPLIGTPPLIGTKVRRTLLGTALIYFWLCYCLMALEYISGPHRPSSYYSFSLLLMILALLLRFADRWAAPADDDRRPG